MTARLHSSTGLYHLSVVYLAWGSTFLAIRFAVQGVGAFAPFTLAALRVGLAGGSLLIFAVLRGETLALKRKMLARLFLRGTLLWVGGHALLIWATQWTDSGFGAILFASIPLWTALFDGFRDPRARSIKMLLPVVLGFLAIVVLTLGSPSISAKNDPTQLVSAPVLTAVILISAFSWALGSFIRTSEEDQISVHVSAGFQQLFAGWVCGIMAMAAGESMTLPSLRACLALSYLVIIGSILAFSSYVRAQQLLPHRIVASFAYVNPVIAVALGYAFAGEQISPMMAGGAVMVIISVVWLFQVNRFANLIQSESSEVIKNASSI